MVLGDHNLNDTHLKRLPLIKGIEELTVGDCAQPMRKIKSFKPIGQLTDLLSLNISTYGLKDDDIQVIFNLSESP